MKRWLPEPGQGYYYITAGGTMAYTRAGDCMYDKQMYYRLATGNYTKTRKGCLRRIKRVYDKFNIPYTMNGESLYIDQYEKVLSTRGHI